MGEGDKRSIKTNSRSSVLCTGIRSIIATNLEESYEKHSFGALIFAKLKYIYCLYQ